MIFFSDPKIKILIKDICNEHHVISKSHDSNIAYLWYMYTTGIKEGTFRPFIFLSELNLLVKLDYFSIEEKENMLGMLNSSDSDNANMVAYAIMHMRNKRLKDYGLWISDNEKYNHINYSTEIINTEIFKNQKTAP